MPLTGEDTGPLPNRKLVLWPYTSPADERLRLTRHGVEIRADAGDPVKVGTGPLRPRLGYLRHGQLFVKEFLAATEGAVPDLGAGTQVYAGQDFCELEMIGGLAEGTVATLAERWSVRTCESIEAAWPFLVEEPA